MKLKKAFFVALAAIIPGLGALWLAKKLITSDLPDERDFRRYVHKSFDKLKADEQQWLQ